MEWYHSKTQIIIFRFKIGYICQYRMTDERSVVQFRGRDGVSDMDNGTVLFDKTVLIGKSLFFQNYLLNKGGILFAVSRVDPLQIKIRAVIQQFAFFDANSSHKLQLA